VHEEELDIVDVVDQEGLVARRHHVSGLLVGAVANLAEIHSISKQLSCHASYSPLSFKAAGRSKIRTDGMAMLPLNRLRTRLSMPLGFRQLRSTHLNRSDWKRLKSFLPVHRYPRQPSRRQKSFACESFLVKFGSGGGCPREDCHVRFFTIGTCFFAGAICLKKYQYDKLQTPNLFAWELRTVTLVDRDGDGS
jgi:hypothetical protein